ncbi:MAG: segregation/condensation protein A, partial [Deltaproteobacteria bacterium]|nr:segregation/condensation protein A [Deltaproteobacteria bacterium]
DEYLKYINTLKELNINFASEFLEMAAELAHIKSKMLLPAEDSAEEAEELDPRADLVRRLIEYQRYKEAATALNERPLLYRDIFSANIPKDNDAPPPEENVLIEGNAFLLLEAFNEMLAKMPKDMVKKAPTLDRMSVNERMLQLLDILKFGKTIPLVDLMPSVITRNLIVVTFLSLLEMVVLRMIKIYQAGRFEAIYVTSTIHEATIEDTRKMIVQRESKVLGLADNGGINGAK